MQAVKFAKAMVAMVHFLSDDKDLKENDGCWEPPEGSGTTLTSDSCVCRPMPMLTELSPSDVTRGVLSSAVLLDWEDLFLSMAPEKPNIQSKSNVKGKTKFTTSMACRPDDFCLTDH